MERRIFIGQDLPQDVGHRRIALFGRHLRGGIGDLLRNGPGLRQLGQEVRRGRRADGLRPWRPRRDPARAPEKSTHARFRFPGEQEAKAWAIRFVRRSRPRRSAPASGRRDRAGPRATKCPRSRSRNISACLRSMPSRSAARAMSISRKVRPIRKLEASAATFLASLARRWVAMIAGKAALAAAAHQVGHRAERDLARLVRDVAGDRGREELRFVDHDQHRDTRSRARHRTARRGRRRRSASGPRRRALRD